MPTADDLFTTDVLPIVRKCALRWAKPGQREDVETLSWLLWRKKPHVRPGVIARFAIRSVRVDRAPSLRGMGAAHGGRPLSWPDLRPAGDCDRTDHTPGPDRLADTRERWKLWWAKLTLRQRGIAWATQEGYRGRDLRELLGVSKGVLCRDRWQMHCRWVGLLVPGRGINLPQNAQGSPQDQGKSVVDQFRAPVLVSLRLAPGRPPGAGREVKMSEFQRVWEQLSLIGACDTWGGMECRRVWAEYLAAGMPEDVAGFIRRRANLMSDGSEPGMV